MNNTCNVGGIEEGGSISPLTDGESNVLLLADHSRPATGKACIDLSSLVSPGRENVLVVSDGRSPDEWLEDWRPYCGERPAEFGFVEVDGTTRSAAATDGGAAAGPTIGPVSVTTGAPDDLNALARTICSYFTRWADNGNRTSVCFDSMASLLAHNERETVARFLLQLRRAVASVDGVAHYHLDPAAQDAETVATITSLFDSVIEVGEDGQWTTSMDE